MFSIVDNKLIRKQVKMSKDLIKLNIMTTGKKTNYELIYTDFLGKRQVQNFIKTKEEAFRRKKKFYNSKDCNAIVKEVVKTYEDGECIDIEKTIIW